MEILNKIIIIILTAVVGYILGKNRDSSKTLFDKKLKIYSDIVYHINSAKEFRVSLDISTEKFRTLVKEVNDLQENKSITSRPYLFKRELEKLDNEISLLNYKDRLIKLFAPARLLGSKRVVDKLREYYSLVSEFCSAEEKKDIHDDFSKKISESAMELEQLMREDLGRFRILSKHEINTHLMKSQEKEN